MKPSPSSPARLDAWFFSGKDLRASHQEEQDSQTQCQNHGQRSKVKTQIPKEKLGRESERCRLGLTWLPVRTEADLTVPHMLRHFSK